MLHKYHEHTTETGIISSRKIWIVNRSLNYML